MSKEHAYAYEAGYRDGSVHYELEHCPACKNVADLQEALKENAKLRDELDLCLKQVKKCEECEAMFNCEDCEAMLDCDECLRADSSQKERKRVDYENAKLRELVRDIMPIVCHGCYERLCEIPKEEHPFVTCSFDDRMRELGVEV